jgi:hypothetical protein
VTAPREVTAADLTDEEIRGLRRQMIGHPDKVAYHLGLISDCDAALTDPRAMAFQMDGVRQGVDRCRQRIASAINSIAANTRMAEERAAAGFALTEAVVLDAMDPNGATLKLGAIVAMLKDSTGHSEYAIASHLQNKLRHMRKRGLVVLIKGAGSGWALTQNALNARRRAP